MSQKTVARVVLRISLLLLRGQLSYDFDRTCCRSASSELWSWRIAGPPQAMSGCEQMTLCW